MTGQYGCCVVEFSLLNSNEKFQWTAPLTYSKHCNTLLFHIDMYFKLYRSYYYDDISL